MASSRPDRPAPGSDLNPAGATAARDRDLVVRIRTGDEEAFADLYRAYDNGLGAFVKSVVQSDDAAEEIIQDLLLRLWEQRHSWEQPTPLGAYLYRTARNRAISHVRHERIETKFVDFPAGDGGDTRHPRCGTDRGRSRGDSGPKWRDRPRDRNAAASLPRGGRVVGSRACCSCQVMRTSVSGRRLVPASRHYRAQFRS